MGNINVTIRMDEDLKKRADELFNDLGMSFSTALNIFVRQAVREYRIPFEIRGEIPNEETKAAIEEVKRMKADLSIVKSYTTVEEMMEDPFRDLQNKADKPVQKRSEKGSETWV